jgi:phosphoribosylanthranilate isomerase
MRIAAKICGLSSEAAVAAAVEGGAAYLGFVFYPPSPRAIDAARAAALCAAVPSGIKRVGLFVDADDAAIRAVLEQAPIDILQFHGHESPERVVEAKLRFNRPVIKAPPRRPDALPGGNGLAFDWRLIAGHRWPRPWMLSGGLTAELLPEAVGAAGATAVDVSSGVERRPGDKDPDKIREFLAVARTL